MSDSDTFGDQIATYLLKNSQASELRASPYPLTAKLTDDLSRLDDEIAALVLDMRQIQARNGGSMTGLNVEKRMRAMGLETPRHPNVPEARAVR